MALKCTPVVFITANVGSIFEEPAVMLKIWTREFLSTIARLDPKFVALHCQEVGGKNYEKSMQHVENFVQLLTDSDELRLFDKVRVFLDEDYSSAENFTALGNFYFIHESIADALIYDFDSKKFVDVSGKEIYSKNIEHVPTKEKSKFPQQFFPECKWSRKGFLRTRWSVSGVVFDLINLHLFHDASNFVAIKSFPSIYSDTRRRALAYTLDRFQTDEHGSVPSFLFGDFNFRVDTKGVVKYLSEGSKCTTIYGEVPKIEFKKEDSIILSLGKKEFSHSDHQTIFSSKEGNWLREFDKELDAFADQLFEFSISFPPSYPFEENSTGDKCYMKTRCPAWCDRVILSHSAIPLVRDTTGPGNVEYGLMGRDVCMGDHKPVYLKVIIKGNSERKICPENNSSLENSNSQQIGFVAKRIERNEEPSDRNLPEKSLKNPGSNYPELDIEKLACSLEALITQNITLTSEIEENVEPNLSRCSTCRTYQHASKMADNPGGEQLMSRTPFIEDEKIIGLLANEMKVPKDVLKKLEVNVADQKPETAENKSLNESDRFSAVKRVNSASLVENKPKKEDWKNSRCNSDVSSNPVVTGQHQNPEMARIWGMSKSFHRGNSRIRLISSSNSLNSSLPRLTSHHSSSEEEWFEEVQESDDEILEVSCKEASDMREMKAAREERGSRKEVNESGDKPLLSDKIASETQLPDLTNEMLDESKTENVEQETSEPQNAGTKVDSKASANIKSKLAIRQKSSDAVEFPSKSMEKMGKTFSILKRLTEGRKEAGSGLLSHGKKTSGTEAKESFENLIVEPNLGAKNEAEETNSLRETRMKFSEKLITSFNTDTFGGDGKKKINQFEKCDLIAKESVESWETIELGEKKLKENETLKKELQKREKVRRKKCYRPVGLKCCCTVQ